jgi:hypothetical protein
MKLFKNEIRFNCSNFMQLRAVQPDNCYNCVRRSGYPANLGGDPKCENFKLKHQPTATINTKPKP